MAGSFATARSAIADRACELPVRTDPWSRFSLRRTRVGKAIVDASGERRRCQPAGFLAQLFQRVLAWLALLGPQGVESVAAELAAQAVLLRQASDTRGNSKVVAAHCCALGAWMSCIDTRGWLLPLRLPGV